MTEQERLSRQRVLDAWRELDAPTFLLLVACANGLLQHLAMQSTDPSVDLKALDATLWFVRTQGTVIT